MCNIVLHDTILHYIIVSVLSLFLLLMVTGSPGLVTKFDDAFTLLSCVVSFSALMMMLGDRKVSSLQKFSLLGLDLH